MVSGSDVTSDGKVLGCSLSKAIHAGISCGISCPQADRACIFGCDPISLAGEIVSDLADCRSPSPVPCISDLRAPGWVDEDVVVILIGDACAMAMSEEFASRGCRVVAIIRSDKCIDDINVIHIPDEMGFVESVGFALGAVASVIESAGIFDAARILADDLLIIDNFSEECRSIASLGPEMLPAFYSTSDIHAAAKACRATFTVCAGKVAFYGELPEFDHNELVGWSDPNEHASALSMVVVRGYSGKDIVTDIVDSMSRVLSENGRDVKTYYIPGDDAVAKDCCALLLGAALARRHV